MDEVTGLDRFEPVPDTAWHDVRVAGPKEDLRLDAHRSLVTVVKNQFHRSAHDVQELVTVRVDLTTMGSWPIDVGDRSDCVSIDSPGRSRRGDLTVIDQSRAMSATLPSKRTGDELRTVAMSTNCPVSMQVSTVVVGSSSWGLRETVTC